MADAVIEANQGAQDHAEERQERSAQPIKTIKRPEAQPVIAAVETVPTVE